MQSTILTLHNFIWRMFFGMLFVCFVAPDAVEYVVIALSFESTELSRDPALVGLSSLDL